MLEALQLFRSKPSRLPAGYTGAAKPPCSRGASHTYVGQPATTGAQNPLAIPRDFWEARPDGTVAAEVGLFQLIVHPNAPGGHARFLVLQHPETCGHADRCCSRPGTARTWKQPCLPLRERLHGSRAMRPHGFMLHGAGREG